MQGKPLQSEELKYLETYFSDVDDYKIKITDDLLDINNLLHLYKGLTAHYSFKTLMYIQQNVPNKGMYEAYLQSLPFHQNVMSILFGECFFFDAYLRRISHLKDPETKKIFEKMLILTINYNITERAGEFRDGNLLSSDMLNLCKENVIELTKELKHELIPLTEIEDFYYYNAFGHPDFYERFMGMVT